MLVSFLAKAIVTLLTIRSGASGGVLQPGIALGASGGAVLGVLWMQVFHTNSIGMYALLGACALLAASQQAPLMAICLVMELADAPINLFVPIGFAVCGECVHRIVFRGAACRFGAYRKVRKRR